MYEKRSSIETVGRLLNRYHLLAAALITVIVIANLIVQRAWTLDAGFLGFELLFALLTILLPTATAITVRWLRSLSGPIGEIATFSDGSESVWMEAQLGNLLVRWAPFVCGVALLVVGLYSTETFWISWGGWAGVLFNLWTGIFFFGYGALAWAFGALLVLVWRISGLPIRCSPFKWPTSQVDAIYRMYFRVLSVAALLYGIAVLSVWVSPSGAQIALQTSVGMLWVVAPAACIILFFLTFHFGVHRLLLRFKQASDDELTTLLDAEYHEWTRSPASEREDRIDKLLTWREHIRKADEWPLGLRAVLLTVTALLIPTIKTIVEFASK